MTRFETTLKNALNGKKYNVSVDIDEFFYRIGKLAEDVEYNDYLHYVAETITEEVFDMTSVEIPQSDEDYIFIDFFETEVNKGLHELADNDSLDEYFGGIADYSDFEQGQLRAELQEAEWTGELAEMERWWDSVRA